MNFPTYVWEDSCRDNSQEKDPPAGYHVALPLSRIRSWYSFAQFKAVYFPVRSTERDDRAWGWASSEEMCRKVDRTCKFRRFFSTPSTRKERSDSNIFFFFFSSLSCSFLYSIAWNRRHPAHFAPPPLLPPWQVLQLHSYSRTNSQAPTRKEILVSCCVRSSTAAYHGFN